MQFVDCDNFLTDPQVLKILIAENKCVCVCLSVSVLFVCVCVIKNLKVPNSYMLLFIHYLYKLLKS